MGEKDTKMNRVDERESGCRREKEKEKKTQENIGRKITLVGHDHSWRGSEFHTPPSPNIHYFKIVLIFISFPFLTCFLHAIP